jgi:type IV fimbrial biogenesis protein FimT
MEQAIVSHRGSGARPPGALRSRAALRARASGITLIELLVTMTVVVILLSIGVPSFRYVTNANRIAGEVNGLLGDLQFARAEAVKEGQTVTVCRSSTGKSCQDLISWEKGWIVFADANGDHTVDAGETILRIQAPFASSDTFRADNGVSYVTFNREGFANFPAGVTTTSTLTLHDSTSNSVWTRCLAVTLIGQMSTQTSGQAGTNCL